jgi:hypothetical protein
MTNIINDVDINDTIRTLREINENLSRIARALENIDKNGVDTFAK